MDGEGFGLVEDELEEVVGCAVGQVVFFGVLPELGRREEHIEAELEGVVHHARDDAFESGGGGLEAGIGVDFDEPGPAVLVDHEIQPEHFEGGRSVPLAKQVIGGLDGMPANLLQLWADLLIEVEVLLRGIEVLLEVVVAELVAILILAVLVAVDLDGIVGEVDELVVGVAQLELVAAGADVALVVPVAAHLAVEAHQQHVAADVELPPVVQQRPVDVLLDYEGLLRVVLPRYLSLHPAVYLLEVAVDGDAVAAVGVLPGLHDPQPLLALLPRLLVLLEVAGELQPGLVAVALHVEGDRQVVEDLLAVALVVGLHVVVQRLLVAQELVALEVVVQPGLDGLLQQL